MSQGGSRVFVGVVALAMGVAAAQGCGNVTAFDSDAGGPDGSATGAAGKDAGASGNAGTNGAAGRASTGAAGTTAAAGTNGAAGTTAAAGTNGAAGRAGTGAAGTTAAAGTNGTAGTTAAAGTNGAAGTMAAAGTNGAAGTLGVAGTLGTACAPGNCPPLAIGDLETVDTTGAPAFDATGFRCKSLAICRTSASCVYYAMDTLGYAHSKDAYADGAELQPAPVKLRMMGGAASQCGDPPVSFLGNETILLRFDGGRRQTVYLPPFSGTELTLYIASDGSTFKDVDLKMPARLRPLN